MDIQHIVSSEFESLAADAPVSKLAGKFDDPTLKGVVVTADGDYRGVVTRRQLTASHHPPDEKVGSLVWHVPRVSPRENVREVAQLMLDSDARLLPVFEGEALVGVVTVDAVLAAVEEFLDAAKVADVYSDDMTTIAPDATFGEVLHVFREHRFTHLPVVEDDTAVGVLSLYEVVPLATRAMDQSQGGHVPGFDGHGGSGSHDGYRSHGGFGSREGELSRVLDLPVRDLMVTPVKTISPDRTLEAAVAKMFEEEISSLIVTGDGSPFGIVTKSDALEALTWEAEGNRAVQVYGTEYLEDITYDEIVDIVEKFDAMDGGTSVLDAKLHLHEHEETLRGTNLLLARLRLQTDRGLFTASGEGYGASHAIHEARDVMERRLRDEKTHGQSKKHPDEAFWHKRFGWMLEEA